MFNDVITEATFSQQGALQLQLDMFFVAEVFASYTNRPLAHFKEVKEAIVLLTLPAEHAVYILQALQTNPTEANFVQYLKECGVHVLQSEQIMGILEERVGY